MIKPEAGDRELLWREIQRAAEIPPALRIYVNRNLRMSGVQALGFDMDHTLALYDRIPFEELAFEQAKQKLLASGFPDEIAALKYDDTFVIRGLIVDKRRGNILKMDQHGYVARAFHGTTPLPDEKRKKLYQTRPVRLSIRDYVPVDTPFSMPEIDLYAQVIDLVERKRWRARDYRALYDDVRGAVDQVHADGSIKNIIAQDPGRYLVPDPTLPATLHRMKEHGYRLFLLTNSEAPYTSLIMDRLLSGQVPSRPTWTEFFDVIVVRAGKPGFFRNLQPADPVILPGVTSEVELGKGLMGGGVQDLEKRLGCGGDRILYFGDHTYGDILKSKRVRLWRTAMVIQELEGEIWTQERLAPQLQKLRTLNEKRQTLDRSWDGLDRSVHGDPPPLMPDLDPSKAMSLHSALQLELIALEREIDDLEDSNEREHNPHWGPIFRTNHELSHFAAQVKEFACIYTGRVSNFLHYPVGKYFQVHSERMVHER